LFRIWLTNVIRRGMPDEKGNEIEKIIEESEEIDTMIYAMEIALRNKMKEMELKGRQEGKIEGKFEGKLEVAKKMFIAGMDLTQISAFIEIPEKDLVKLITIDDNATKRT